MKDLKVQLVNQAMKMLQTDTAQKVMASPSVQNAMSFVFQASFKVKNEVQSTKRKLASALDLVTKEELRELRRNVERLERRVKKEN